MVLGQLVSWLKTVENCHRKREREEGGREGEKGTYRKSSFEENPPLSAGKFLFIQLIMGGKKSFLGPSLQYSSSPFLPPLYLPSERGLFKTS